MSADAKSSGLFGTAGVVMALCCLAGPAIVGAAAGAAIGNLLGVAAAVVVGVSVERSSGDSHNEPAATAETSEASETGEEAQGEEVAAETDEDEDQSLLGVDLEATPFLVLAAAVAALAGVVAVLHLAAAAVALSMGGSSAWAPHDSLA